MRKVLFSLAAAALVVSAAPTTALAAQSQHSSIDHVLVSCDRLTGDAGTVRFAAVVNVSADSWASLFWTSATHPEIYQPISGTGDPTLSADGSRLTASIDLYDPTVDPEVGFVGTAQVNLTLTPLGDPIHVREMTGKDSNRKVWIRGEEQLLAVSGQLRLPGGAVFDASGCEGSDETTTTSYNQPDSSVLRTDGVLYLSCAWSLDGMTVRLSSFRDPYDHPADVSVETPDAAYYGGTENALFTESVFSTAFDLSAAATGDESGSLSADATLVPTSLRTRTRSGGPTSKETVVTTVLSVDGSLSLSLSGRDLTLGMNADACIASSNRIQVIQSMPNGR